MLSTTCNPPETGGKHHARNCNVRAGDARLVEPTDALIRVTHACGSDLHPYHQMERSETGTRMGHEAIGVVEDVGSQVTKIKKGDLVVMPFAYSDGTCEFCREGLPTACVHVGFFGNPGYDGAQAEAVRIPYADGTLFALPVGEDDALMPSLLTLSDVMATGTRRSPPRCQRSSATSPWAAGLPRSGRTSRISCRTSSKAGSSPARSSIASWASTRCRTATGRWTTASRSRLW